MKKYDTILFDLDGTLTDSSPGIVNSIVYALKKFDISVDDTGKLRKFLGPPLHESFKMFYGFSDEKAIGVEYGYGDYSELKNAGATYIVKTVENLKNLLVR